MRVEDCLTSLLSETLACMRKNLKMSRQINEGENIAQIAQKNKVDPIATELDPLTIPEWWLEESYKKVNNKRSKISYARRVFALYLILAIIPVPFILGISDPIERQICFFAGFIGSMTVFVILFPLKAVNEELRKLIKNMNQSITGRLVSQCSLIGEEQLHSQVSLKKLDTQYRNLYIKPVVIKTIQSGIELSFSKRFQVFSGLVSSGIFSVIFSARYFFHVIPPSVFDFWTPTGTLEIKIAWLIYSFFACWILWFLVGMLAWSLFIVFMISLQISAQTMNVRPFESIRDVFYPVTNLILKTSFALTASVAWASPYILVWGLVPRATSVQSAINTVEGILAVLIPVIVLSLIIPFLTIHTGMDRSRQRGLLIKQHRLETLRKNPKKDKLEHLRIQSHLIADYRFIVENSEWALSSTQLLEVLGTILLPILAFLASLLK